MFCLRQGARWHKAGLKARKLRIQYAGAIYHVMNRGYLAGGDL